MLHICFTIIVISKLKTKFPKIVAENGAVYECLFKHKFDNAMSPGCRKAITLRQKVISSQDYKVMILVFL